MVTGLCVTDATGRLFDVNPAYGPLDGYSRDELRGMNVLDLIHPDYHVKFISFSDQIASGGRFHGETVELRKDRAEIWIEVRGGPIRRERELRFPGIARNVTERRQSEEELRKYLNGHADADHGRL